MAANGGVDSYNFLRSSLSKGNQKVLVVGDGNFSFSLSLALLRDEVGLDAQLVLTSFDSKDILVQDELTGLNLKRLQACKNVEILHNIDATKLSEYFIDRTFSRIIFNFPHTGGKSNIKKCRKLLEDFFMSAVSHVALNGEICVTLCKGQGGTPMDESNRGYGNSWQIVNNAAKAGLILNQLHPFLASDYDQYKSVGFRGKLTRSFHTAGGLIHIFIPSVKIDSIEDLSGKSDDELLSYVWEQYNQIMNTTQCFDSSHPLYDIKNKILNVLNSVTDASFEEILETNNDTCDVIDSEDFLHLFENNVKVTATYNKKILSSMKRSPSFVLTDTALTASDEIIYISSMSVRYLALCRFYDSEDENNHEKGDSEQELIVDKLKKLFSTEDESLHEVSSEIMVEYDDSKIPTWTNSSDVAHLARSKCQVKRKSDLEQDSAECLCKPLCRGYLRNDARIGSLQRMPMEFFDKNTVKVFHISSSVAVVSGCIKREILRFTAHRHGWLILVNLDIISMIQYNITDIRLLSSCNIQWERQSKKISEEVDQIEKTTFIPLPISLFPSTHVHDISFWISDNVSQELFFLTTMALTKNCVKEIKLTEIYHDEDKHMLSFNYRIIYSRVDGPLSHLEAVELQNRLRRALIVLGFGLK